MKEKFNSPATIGYTREEFIDYSLGRSSGGGSATGRSDGAGNNSFDGVAIPQIGMFEQGVSVNSTGSGLSSFSGASSSDSSFWADMSSETHRTALVPELQWLPTQSYSLDEQLYQLSVLLQIQDTQYAMYRLPGQIFYCIKTPTVYGSIIDDRWLEKEKTIYGERRTDLFSSKESVQQSIQRRKENIIRGLAGQKAVKPDDEDTPEDEF